MSTPGFVKPNEDYLEIQLSNKNLSNETLFHRIGQLEEYLHASDNSVKLDLDLSGNPKVTERDDDMDGFGRLVLFLRDFGPSVKRLRLGGTGISGRGLCQLVEFIKLGVAEELDFSGLPSVEQDDVMALLMAVKECQQYPLNKTLPLLLRLDRNGLEDPHHILAMLGDDLFCEVLSNLSELQKVQAVRSRAASGAGVSPTDVMISLPFFYVQHETEDIVTTPPPLTPPTAPATPPDKPPLNLKAKAPAPPPPPMELEEIKLEEEEDAVAGSLPKAFRGSAHAKKAVQLNSSIIPLVKPKRPDHEPSIPLLWKAMHNSPKAKETLEVVMRGSTRAKAWVGEENDSKKNTRAKAWSRSEPPTTAFSKPGSDKSPIGVSPPPNKRPRPTSIPAAATPVPPPMPPPSWTRGETSAPPMPPLPPPPKPMPVPRRPNKEDGEATSVISKTLMEVVDKGGQFSVKATSMASELLQKTKKTSDVKPTSSEVRTVPSPQKKQALSDAQGTSFKQEEEWQEWKGKWYKWDNQANRWKAWEEKQPEKEWRSPAWWRAEKAEEEWHQEENQEEWHQEENQEEWHQEENQAWNTTEVKEEWKEDWKDSRTEWTNSSWNNWKQDEYKTEDSRSWEVKEEEVKEEDWSKSSWDKQAWKDYDDSEWKGYSSWKASAEEENQSTSASSHQDADAEEKPKAESEMDEMEEIQPEEEPDEEGATKIGGYIALLHKLGSYEGWDVPIEKKLEELNETKHKEKTSSEEGSEEEAAAIKPSSAFSLKDKEDDDMADDAERAEIEETVRISRETIQRAMGGEAAGPRGLKRSRSPQEPSYPPPKKGRRDRRDRDRGPKRPSKSGRRGRHVDDSRQMVTVPVNELFFSQRSCKDKFQCGRPVDRLVDDLMRGEVDLNASFLRLTVFETRDEKSRKTVLRCIDNRRLLALKDYAKRIGKPNLRVNVSLFDEYTLTQVSRFFQNSDDTDGREVRLRKSRNDKRQAS